MSNRELSNTYPSISKGFFDFPAQLHMFEEFMPRDLIFRTPELKAIKIEEFVKDGKLIIRAEIPGVVPERDIDIFIREGYLTIKGERREEKQDEHRSEFTYGMFSRSIALPNGFDDTSIHANYVNGILEVSLDLPAKEIKEKKIAIHKKDH